MGVWDRITGQARAQFLDVLEWVDTTRDTLVWRFPTHDRAITDQSRLVVREGQVALFLADGALSEQFAPGAYTLDTPNAPLLRFLQSIRYAMETPYKGEVLFVSTRQFTANKWGTQAPFMMRDAEFGPVRVRAFGSFSFRVVDAARFLREIVGTDGDLRLDDLTGQLKQRVVSVFAAEVAGSGLAVLDLAARYPELGERIRTAMNTKFEAEYGVTLTDFTIANIGLPEAVEKALDTRSKMGILGNLDQYARLNAAEAIGTAAANEGIGGAMAGAGVGLGLGQMLGQTVAAATAPAAAPAHAAPPQAPPPVAAWHHHGPAGQGERTVEQIVAAIQSAPTARHLVWRAGMAGWVSWSDVPEIASRVGPPPVPPAVPPPVPGE